MRSKAPFPGCVDCDLILLAGGDDVLVARGDEAIVSVDGVEVAQLNETGVGIEASDIRLIETSDYAPLVA
jgi:hypothetical protein